MIAIGGPRLRDQRPPLDQSPDPTLLLAPRRLKGKKSVGFSPTRRKK